MSSTDQGVGSVIYPGIKQIVSASYTRSHGIAPDVCMIEMAPQTLNPNDSDYVPIEAEGFLIFQFDEVIGTRTNQTQIVLQGCRADKGAVKRSENSEVWSIPIFDRRWKWKFGSFSGHWNIKKNGVIEKRKEKTARELADLCLDAMGEINYDTTALKQLEKSSSLPYRNKVRPEVHWDRIAPAEALEELVTSLGYRVCLGWDDRVRICKYGEGALLPTDDLMSGGFEDELPEVPASFTVVGDITMHEALWELEAVGLDIDGEWRPIDHLSYRPDGLLGWHNTRPPNYPGIEEKFEKVESNFKPSDPIVVRRKEQLKLARETVYRCYRLKYPFGTKEHKSSRTTYDELGKLVGAAIDSGAIRGNDPAYDRLVEKYEEAGRKLFEKSEPILPGPKKINPKSGKLDDYILEEFEQILPIFETRAELAVDPYTGRLHRKHPVATGSFYTSRKEHNTWISEYIQRDKYEVIPEQGIIKFDDPMVRMGFIKIDGDDRIMSFPADLRILIAVPLKSLEGEPARFTYEFEIPKKFRNTPARLPTGLKGNVKRVTNAIGTKVIHDHQIVLAYQAKYKFQGTQSTGNLEIRQTGVLDNIKPEALEEQALIAIDVEMLRLNTGNGGSGVYAGLKKIGIDGAIQQVTINRNESGMTTSISHNREIDVIVPSFDERQRNMALKQMIKMHNQKIDKTQKVKPKG